ncbi:MAG: hypothetical protein LBU00_04640 [Treponema sp.]|nr:hypothetical protein [Treponema sp.]
MGRKGFATNGKEHEGRVFYEQGISLALSVFQEAQSSRDPETMLLTESSFLQQEFYFCAETDAGTRNSLIQAIQSIEDALRCLKIVEDAPAYRSAEATYPTASKYRYQSFPRDAVHLACAAHWTRLQNSLRTPGINMIEKAVLQQRAANMKTVQYNYLEKQRKTVEEFQTGRMIPPGWGFAGPKPE